jgi:hypothetical protein
VYGYQGLSWGSVIQASGIGSQVVEQTDPYVQPKKWKAVSDAFNFIKDLEPYILQPNVSAPNLGPLVFSAAKEGNGGRLVMATSFSEVPLVLNVDFTPYTFGGRITRYRVSATGYTNAPVTGSGEAVTLLPGETVAYLFQP